MPSVKMARKTEQFQIFWLKLHPTMLPFWKDMAHLELLGSATP
jgi:hypothetical protein